MAKRERIQGPSLISFNSLLTKTLVVLRAFGTPNTTFREYLDRNWLLQHLLRSSIVSLSVLLRSFEDMLVCMCDWFWWSLKSVLHFSLLKSWKKGNICFEKVQDLWMKMNLFIWMFLNNNIIPNVVRFGGNKP